MMNGSVKNRRREEERRVQVKKRKRELKRRKTEKDECMVVKRVNAIGEKNLNGSRKKKSHTFR